MNVLDYMLLGLLVAFLIRGYVKGFFFQMLQIVGVVLAFFVAAKFHTTLAQTDVFREVRQRHDHAAQVVSFLVIFFAVAAVVSVLASYVSRRARNLHLKSGDSMLGALLGLSKGVLLLGGVALGLKQWGFPQGALLPAEVEEEGEWLVSESVLVPKLAEGCLTLVALIPERGREEINRLAGEPGRMLNLDPGAAPDEGAESSADKARRAPLEPPAGAGDDHKPSLPSLGTLVRHYREETCEPSRFLGGEGSCRPPLRR